MIEVEDLNAAFGTFELKHVTLRVTPGEHFVLLGPSGAGKTVLTETIIGLRPCVARRLVIGGRHVHDATSRDLSVSYVPQDLALFPHLSVRKNIAFGAAARKLSASAMETRVVDLARLLEIEHLTERKSISTLSMGERQRVVLARALIVEPKALFLDEPFSSLDHHIKRQLIEKLRDIKKMFGVTIFHVTHDHEEAFMLGDRCAILFNGRIVQIGVPADLQDAPATPHVARFLLARNLFDGVVSEVNNGATVVKVDGDVLVSRCGGDRRVGEKVVVVIRPEETHIIRPDRPIGPKVRENIFDATVEKAVAVPGGYIVSLGIKGFSRLVETNVSNCAFGDLGIEKGKAVRVSLKSESLWLMNPAEPGR